MPAEPAHDAAQDRRPLRVVHGRRARRGARRRAAAAAARRGRGGRGPGRARRACSAACSAQGRASLFGTYVSTDAKDSEPLPRAPRASPGSACPTSRTTARTRTPRSAPPYVAHLERMLGLVGLDRPAADRAGRVMDLETALAAAHWDRVDNRDAEKTYTLMTLRRAAASRARRSTGRPGSTACGAPEGAFAEVVRAPAVSFVDGRRPRCWASARSSSGRRGWRIRHRARHAPYLSNDAFVEENFDFYGRTLVGHPGAARALEARRRRSSRARSARRSASSTSSGTSRRAAKERMDELVANLVEAYRQSITDARLDGPGDPGARAGRSSRKFTPKIGYPDEVARLLGARGAPPTTCSATCARPREFEYDRELGQDRQAGRPRRVVHDPADGQRLLQPAA